MRTRWFGPALVATYLSSSGLAVARDRDEEPDPVIFRIALADSTVTLQAGMAAGAHQGRPVSARFEMPDGDLQLGVFTATRSGFVETILDPKGGVVISTAQITDADDLAEAIAQKAAMERATVPLVAATERAIEENPGSRAVSVVPELRNGHPVAIVTLQQSRRFRRCSGSVGVTALAGRDCGVGTG
jgi:hypothetical protein